MKEIVDGDEILDIKTWHAAGCSLDDIRNKLTDARKAVREARKQGRVPHAAKPQGAVSPGDTQLSDHDHAVSDLSEAFCYGSDEF